MARNDQRDDKELPGLLCDSFPGDMPLGRVNPPASLLLRFVLTSAGPPLRWELYCPLLLTDLLFPRLIVRLFTAVQ